MDRAIVLAFTYTQLVFEISWGTASLVMPYNSSLIPSEEVHTIIQQHLSALQQRL